MVHGGCVGVYIWDGEGKLAAFTDSSWAVPFLWGFVEVAVVSLSPVSLWCGRGLMAAAFWGYYNFNTYVGLFWGNICVRASGLLGHDTFLSFSVSMVPAGSDGSRPPQTRSPFFLFLRFMIWLSAQQKWSPKQAAHGVALLTFHFPFSEPISPSSPLTLWVHHVCSLYIFPTHIYNPLFNKIQCNLHAWVEIKANEKVSRFGYSNHSIWSINNCLDSDLTFTLPQQENASGTSSGLREPTVRRPLRSHSRQQSLPRRYCWCLMPSTPEYDDTVPLS